MRLPLLKYSCAVDALAWENNLLANRDESGVAAQSGHPHAGIQLIAAVANNCDALELHHVVAIENLYAYFTGIVERES